MAFRKRKQRNSNGMRRFIGVCAAALAVPVCLHAVRAQAGLFSRIGQQAAIVSVAMNTPGSSLSLLEERFRDEILSSPYEGDNLPSSSSPTPYVPEDRPGIPSVSQPEQPAGEAGSQPESSAAPAPRAVKIPQRYQGDLLSENFAGSDGGTLIRFGAGFIKNETTHDNDVIEGFLETGISLGLQNTDEPQVLIVHTHATESFELYDAGSYDTRNTWRSTDNNLNMVAVGDAMAEVLEANGIGVIHDTSQHDYPSYNGAYDRSAKSISHYLEEYPSIKIVLDLHRDAIQRGDSIVKPVATIDGKKAAQIMIISACDDGTIDVPNWKENLRFAALLQDYMETDYPQLTRPVYLCYRKYNMHLTTGSLLLEFGSNANTLEEAVYSAQLAGQALSNLIRDNTEE